MNAATIINNEVWQKIDGLWDAIGHCHNKQYKQIVVALMLMLHWLIVFYYIPCTNAMDAIATLFYFL